MHNGINGFKNYIRKRANRKEFCFFLVMVSLGFIAALVLVMIIYLIVVLLNILYLFKLPLINPGASAKVIFIIAVISCLPGAICRLHDVGKSWMWIIPGFIPNFGTVWLVVLYIALFFVSGDPEPNKYGPPSSMKEEKNVNSIDNVKQTKSMTETIYESRYGMIYEMEPSNGNNRRKQKALFITTTVIAIIGASLIVLLIVLIVKFIIYFLAGWAAIG